MSELRVAALIARHEEQWGDFPQTYSMVGLINAAIRLSVRRDRAC